MFSISESSLLRRIWINKSVPQKPREFFFQPLLVVLKRAKEKSSFAVSFSSSDF